ncbi:MAG: hypothetical protein R8G66_17600 [Cytophagales bacterium]|nr:hypothetical protein [Cytophagales bacterium]
MERILRKQKLSIKVLAVIVLTTIFTACEDSEILDQPSDIYEVTHHYEFNSNIYSIVYELNNEHQVLSAHSDSEGLKSFQEFYKQDEGGLLVVEQVSANGKEVYFKYIAASERKDEGTISGRMECTDWFDPGTASYNFYRHINFVDELVALRKTNTRYFQDQWLGNDNDQISSFRLGNRSELHIFEHSCFFGGEYPFRSDISNLHHVLIGYQISANGNVTPVVRDLNDWISSLKGWSY